MRTRIVVPQDDSWNADAYLHDYYSSAVPPDEIIALRFQVNALQATNRSFERAIEFGAGPVVSRAIATVPYAGRYDVTDLVPANLEHWARWKNHDPGAHDWSAFTAYILRCEGATVSLDRIAEREEATRRMIGDLHIVDARFDEFFLANSFAYDLLVTGFCLECVSARLDVWEACLARLLTLLKPGGVLSFAAIGRGYAYRIGKRWYAIASLTTEDVRRALIRHGIEVASLRIEEVPLPEHRTQGYDSIIVAAGAKSR